MCEMKFKCDNCECVKFERCGENTNYEYKIFRIKKSVWLF